MLPTQQGAVRLFTVAGITVFLHWSWFVVAVFEIQSRQEQYSTLTWNALEYIALFFIVMLHEFGHALACRQVGGQAHRIVLWPLGGVAYVLPPPRPGAQLWSIAAGPMVNLLLIPVFLLVGLFSGVAGWIWSAPDFHALLRSVAFINLGILIFNLLPVYPLDGGQILRSLLWFVVGPIRSLQIAVAIGFVGVAALIAVAVWFQSIWIGIIAAFVFFNCRVGWLQARELSRRAAELRSERP